MMPARPLVILIVGSTLGCVSSPEQREPELGVDVPSAWTTTTPATPWSEEPSLTWWETFGIPELGSLVDEVLAHNHDLQSASARILLASAQANVARADVYPQLSAGFGAQRQRQNFIGFPVPGGDDVRSSHATSLGVSLDLTWELDLWGRLRAGAEGARADFEGALADYQAASLSLMGQAVKLWFTITEAREQVRLAEDTVDSFRRTARQVRDRYDRGLRPPLDVRLSLSEVGSAEAALERRLRALDSLKRQLEVLLGRYPAAELAASSELPPLGEDIPGGLPATLISRRPDLVAAERRLAAAGARLKAARRSLYPRISLTASGGTRSDELSDLTNGDFSIWTLAGNALQPIFQGGRLLAGVDGAKAVEEEALAQYVQSALTAYAEVETALATETYLAREEIALRTATEQAIAARALAETRYASGLDDFVTVLAAQRGAFTSESLLLNVQRQRLENRVDLFLALGGGYTDPRDKEQEEELAGEETEEEAGGNPL
jgi:NodT family efflux transporter outer membrane factor (OMF) lipoprotein